MKKLRWSVLSIAAFAGVGVTLSGCATKSAQSVVVPAATTESGAPAPAIDLKALNAADGSGARIVTKDYANVQVTGSLLPTKMPTDPNAHALPNANPVRTMSPEEFERVVDRGLSGRRP